MLDYQTVCENMYCSRNRHVVQLVSQLLVIMCLGCASLCVVLLHLLFPSNQEVQLVPGAPHHPSHPLVLVVLKLDQQQLKQKRKKKVHYWLQSHRTTDFLLLTQTSRQSNLYNGEHIFTLSLDCVSMWTIKGRSSSLQTFG